MRNMSFASQLVQRKSALVHTKTKLTTLEGQVFTEERKADGFTRQLGDSENASGFVVDLKPDLQVACVIPGLTMGSQDVVTDLKLLRANSITHILNVGHEPTIQFETVSYLHSPLLDIPECDILHVLPHCISFIDGIREQGGTVFVHCNAGVSRSAAVVIAYLMQDQLITLEEAYRHLKQIRPSIQPNAGFVNQLKMYERSIQV